MKYPEVRMRRIRKNRDIEDLVAETVLRPTDMILPLFFDENIDADRPVNSMPGVVNHPLKGYDAIAQGILGNGIRSVIVFGNPSGKDPQGSQAYASDGVSQKAIRGLKDNSDLYVIADLCMCEYILPFCAHTQTFSVSCQSAM